DPGDIPETIRPFACGDIFLSQQSYKIVSIRPLAKEAARPTEVTTKLLKTISYSWSLYFEYDIGIGVCIVIKYYDIRSLFLSISAHLYRPLNCESRKRVLILINDAQQKKLADDLLWLCFEPPIPLNTKNLKILVRCT